VSFIWATCFGDFRDTEVLEVTMCFPFWLTVSVILGDSMVLGVKYEIGHETPVEIRHHFPNVFGT